MLRTGAHSWDVTVGLAASHLDALVRKRLPLTYRCQHTPPEGGQFELAAWRLLGGEANLLRLRAENSRFVSFRKATPVTDLAGSHFDVVVQLAALLDPAPSAKEWCSFDFAGYEHLPVPMSRQRAAELGDSFQELLEGMRPALQRLFVNLNAEAFAAHPWLPVTSQTYAYVNRGGLALDYVGILAMTSNRVAPEEATFPSLDLNGHEFVYHISDYILTKVIIHNLNRLFFQLDDNYPAVNHLPRRCTAPLYLLGGVTADGPQHENEPYEFIASQTDGPSYSIPEDKLVLPNTTVQASSGLRQKFRLRYVLLNYLYFIIQDGQLELRYQTEAGVQTQVFVLDNPFTLTTTIRQAYAYVLKTSADGHQTIGTVEVAGSRQMAQTRDPEHTDVEVLIGDLSALLSGLLDQSCFQVASAAIMSPIDYMMVLMLNQLLLGEAVYALHDEISVSLIEQRLANLFTLPEFAGLDVKRVHLHLGLLVSGDLTLR